MYENDPYDQFYKRLVEQTQSRKSHYAKIKQQKEEEEIEKALILA